MKNKLMDIFFRNTQMTEQVIKNCAIGSEQQIQQEKFISTYLQRTEPVYFRAGFADRVISRIQSIKFNEQEDFFTSMVWIFKRVALTGTVAAVILLAFTLLNEPIDVQQLYYASSQVSLDELANPATAWSLEEF